jgi:hypothetical protein
VNRSATSPTAEASHRALIEGLFGVRPDALAGELRIAPGFPAAWDRASLRHPNVTVDFRRESLTETYTVETHFGKPMKLRLEVAAQRATVVRATVDGRRVAVKRREDVAGHPVIASTGVEAARHRVVIVWGGAELAPKGPFESAKVGQPGGQTTDWTAKMPASTRWESLDLAAHFNDRVTEIFRPGKYVSPRSPFCSLALHNPTNWWPIDQDYFIDDFAFARPEPVPRRVDLRTGHVRILNVAEFKGKGGTVPGGAATVLNLALDPARELQSLTVRTFANEVVIGLMAATLER